MTLKLCELPERDRQKVEEVLAQLIRAHSEGRVRSICIAYYDQANGACTHVSDNMSLRDYAYAIQLLSKDFRDWLDASEAPAG